MNVQNKRWTDAEFLARRKEVLSRWPTGMEVDLNEAIAYHRNLPPEKVHVKAFSKARQDGKIPLRLQVGHATVEETLDHIRSIEEAGVARILVQVDGHTRKNRYDVAQRLLDESLKVGRSLMTGFPIVNHGVMKSRQLVENARVPLQVTDYDDEEPELQAEISRACGIAAGCYSCLRVLVQHCKDYPLDKRIENDQYGCRLAAYYTERGAPIMLETYASALEMATPGLGGAVGVLETLLAAEQGVKYLDLQYNCKGNLIQDVAAIRGTRDVVLEYLHRFGHNDVKVGIPAVVGFGEYPFDEFQAAGEIAWFTVVCALANVDSILARGVGEATGIAGKQSQVKGLKVVRQILENELVANQRLPVSPELSEEEEMFKLEVRALVDKVVELGEGDPAVGMVKAVPLGILDFPCSSWIHVKNKVLCVHDRANAVRYLDTGNLPLPREVIQYHGRKIAERERAENKKADVEMMIEDYRRKGRSLVKELAC